MQDWTEMDVQSVSFFAEPSSLFHSKTKMGIILYALMQNKGKVISL